MKIDETIILNCIMWIVFRILDYWLEEAVLIV